MFTSNVNRKQVVLLNSSAVKVVKVEGGYMVFDTMSAYTTWKNQK